MSLYGWKGRYFEVDPGQPRAEGICDRCGFRFNLENLQWQYDFRGTTRPINTRILVCGRSSCMDEMQPQNSPLILSPDPEPIFNARPETYVLDETSWLATQDGDVYTEIDGDLYLANIGDNGAVAFLETAFSVPSGDVSVMYLDIFNGDPSAGGTSVLAQITGSATRTNIAADLTTVLGIAQNNAQIVVAAESGATVNTNYIGFYSASSSGALLMSGPLSVNGHFVTVGNPVAFDALGIQIDIS